MNFFHDFLIFNYNAFYELAYFLSQNIGAILIFAGCAYCFRAEISHSRESEVRDERPIL